MTLQKNARRTPITLISQQINQVKYGRKQVIVEGIEIDFRHPKFNPENWEVPRGLFIVRDLGGDGPNLSFPWSERSEEGIDELGSSTQPDDSLPATPPDCILELGDRLYIRKIETVSTDNPLLRGCNPNRVKVYINIHKVKGGLIEIQRPIVLKPHNELWERDFIGNYYRAIEGRIKHYFKTGDVADIKNTPDDRSFAYRALRKLSVINRISSSVNETTVGGQRVDVVLPSVPDQEYHDNSSVWFTINDAVALGYLWAKSEDERNWVRFDDDKGSQVSAAGLLSAARRGEDAEKWKRVLREIVAEASASATKKLTRTKMVEMITNDRERWDTTRRRLNLPNAAMPGVHSLRKEASRAMRALERNEEKDG